MHLRSPTGSHQASTSYKSPPVDGWLGGGPGGEEYGCFHLPHYTLARRYLCLLLPWHSYRHHHCAGSTMPGPLAWLNRTPRSLRTTGIICTSVVVVRAWRVPAAASDQHVLLVQITVPNGVAVSTVSLGQQPTRGFPGRGSCIALKGICMPTLHPRDVEAVQACLLFQKAIGGTRACRGLMSARILPISSAHLCLCWLTVCTSAMELGHRPREAAWDWRQTDMKKGGRGGKTAGTMQTGVVYYNSAVQGGCNMVLV